MQNRYAWTFQSFHNTINGNPETMSNVVLDDLKMV